MNEFPYIEQQGDEWYLIAEGDWAVVAGPFDTYGEAQDALVRYHQHT